MARARISVIFGGLLTASILALLLASVGFAAGSVSFVINTDFSTGAFSTFVAIGDLNGDGKPDLAVANFLSDNVSILLGTSAGFAPKTDFPSGLSPRSVAIGDQDGDGKPDPAVANFSNNTVLVLLGDRGGSFGTNTMGSPSGVPRFLT